MEFDVHLAVLSAIGGIIFGTSLIRLIFDSWIPLPPFRAMWKTYIALSILFFISYYGAIYANRALDNVDILHSMPTTLTAYVMFNIGMVIASIAEEYRRNKYGKDR